MQVNTKKIRAIPVLCSGCMMCQLACSFVRTRSYNPAQSSIIIEEESDTGSFNIAFSDQCNDCGVCIRYCLYGALEKKKKNQCV